MYNHHFSYRHLQRQWRISTLMNLQKENGRVKQKNLQIGPRMEVLRDQKRRVTKRASIKIMRNRIVSSRETRAMFLIYAATLVKFALRVMQLLALVKGGCVLCRRDMAWNARSQELCSYMWCQGLGFHRGPSCDGVNNVWVCFQHSLCKQYQLH